MQKIRLYREDMDFRCREAYRTLRTNVEYSGEGIKVVTVTSCLPGEDKSTTAFELAKVFAQQGKKTLLIDADLRKSQMSNISVDGPVKNGLTNFLVGKQSVMDILTETDLRNLFVIFAGYVPPNPSELLSSEGFHSLIEASREAFDMVIIDTPPIGSAIDGAIVAKQTDGAILVIKQASVSYPLAKHVKQQLTSLGIKILGCVLNEVGSGKKGVYGRYYSKYYSDGGRYFGKAYQKAYGEYYGDPGKVVDLTEKVEFKDEKLERPAGESDQKA